MEYAAMFWWFVFWMLVWGTIGGVFTPRFYVRRNKDVSQARLAGASMGAATGPFGLIPLWRRTPSLTTGWLLAPSILALVLFMAAFALSDPSNICVANPGYVVSQLGNGLIMGTIYGLMAMGLALIFSILGVVSFAHGEFYMIGGMVVYFFTAVWFPEASPILAVLAACLVTLAIGAGFEKLFLTVPKNLNKVAHGGFSVIRSPLITPWLASNWSPG